jgi:hypothetical protein
VLGPTIIPGHEIEPKQVDVKDFLGGVIILILTDTTWTTNKTIPLVCLSHTDKIMQDNNEIERASVIVHPLLVYLHYISISKTITKHQE